MPSSYLLGIDTGGTYTDAVLFCTSKGIASKAKSLTTRHNLAEGIAGAVDGVLAAGNVAATDIAMVSLSTTLATNALVEGLGGRAALIMIGFAQEDLDRAGLGEAIGDDPVIFLPGGHDVHGRETPLQMTDLESAVGTVSGTVSAFAVAGYFAVRNPDHELRVRDRLRELTGLPVTCSHELSAKLGGPRRALTTLLNARLVPIIDQLVDACEEFLQSRDIVAPMMVVRGDGALISAAEARLRPIETILSGPAASLIGARYLTGLDCAVVSDIGGTTTDIAVLEGGLPKLAEEGAVVGGYRTMVEAVDMRTFGLGGDSEVHIDERGLKATVRLGPRRLLPISLAGTQHSEAVMAILERQLRSPRSGRHDGRIAVATGVTLTMERGLGTQEQDLLDKIRIAPLALQELLVSLGGKAALERLVSRGLVYLCGITPSDALHVLGHQEMWNRDAARYAFELAARHKDGSGRALADSADELAQKVVACLTRQSSEAVLVTCLEEERETGIINPATCTAVDRALKRSSGIVRFSVSLDRPLVGLGASARLYYPAIAKMLDIEPVIPVDADVANAIGAVVGQVRSIALVVVTSPSEGRYSVSGSGESLVFTVEQDALAEARQRAKTAALEQAARDGAVDAVVTLTEEIDRPEVEGLTRLLEARIVATASGRPRTVAR